MKTFKDKIKNTSDIVTTIMALKSLADASVNIYNERINHQAVILKSDPIYAYLTAWLAKNSIGKNIQLSTTGGTATKISNAKRRQAINIDGHKLHFYIDDGISNDNAMSLNAAMTFSPEKLVFIGKSTAAIDALQRKIDELNKQRQTIETRPLLYYYSTWGWDDSGEIPPRPMESIFLPPGVKEDVLSDINFFLASEEKFVRLGIPWHRGYLFHGPPGNGKTSMVKGLATALKRDIFHLPLSALPDDRELYKAINRVTRNSILILEDIDIFKAVDRDHNPEKGPTLAGLLNCLDGVCTPHGLISVMTTNNINALDPALIRTGRVDKTIEVGPPSLDQMQQMFRYIYGEEMGVEPVIGAMSDFAEIIKQNLNDAEGARMELKLWQNLKI